MLQIYTDGGCHGNPGPGGWAWAIYLNGKLFRSDCGYSHQTTNNEMELTAIFRSLKSLSPEITKVQINSDSTYAINTLTLWGKNWVRNGSIYDRPNSKLIIDLLNLLDQLRNNGVEIVFNKVKGHSGIEGNEYVDRLLTECINCNGLKSESTTNEIIHQLISFEVGIDKVRFDLEDGSKVYLTRSDLSQIMNLLK